MSARRRSFCLKILLDVYSSPSMSVNLRMMWTGCLILVPVIYHLCHAMALCSLSPDGASATAVLASPLVHVHTEQQQKRRVVFPRAVLSRNGNA